VSFSPANKKIPDISRLSVLPKVEPLGTVGATPDKGNYKQFFTNFIERFKHFTLRS